MPTNCSSEGVIQESLVLNKGEISFTELLTLIQMISVDPQTIY